MNFEWSFKTADHDPAGTFTIIPVGDYPSVVSGVEVKATSAGDGGMLEIEETITAGPFQGNKLFNRLNLWHASEQTREIAQRQLAAYGLVLNIDGFGSLGELQKLKGIPHQIVVGLQKYKEGSTKLQNGQTKEQWEAIGYTEIKGVKDASGNPPKKGQPYTGANAGGNGGGAPAGGNTPWGGGGSQGGNQPPQGQKQPTQQAAQGGSWGGGGTEQQATQNPGGGAPWGNNNAAAGNGGGTTAPWGQ